jgi:hypothetical protein
MDDNRPKPVYRMRLKIDPDLERLQDKRVAWAKEIHERRLAVAEFHLESADRYALEAVKVGGTIGVAGLVGSSSLLAINPAWVDFDKAVAIQAVISFGESLIALIVAVFFAYIMQLCLANAANAVKLDYSSEPVKETEKSVWLRSIGWGFWCFALVAAGVAFWRLWGGFHKLSGLF